MKMRGFENGIKMNLYRIAAATLGIVLAWAPPSEAAPEGSLFIERESRVENRIRRATKEKDIILLNCLQPRLTELKNLHRIGMDSISLAQEARSQENADLEEHHLTKVKIVEEESEKLVATTLLCVAARSDQTVVWVIVSEPNMGGPEVSAEAPPASTRPPDASPID